MIEVMLNVSDGTLRVIEDGAPMPVTRHDLERARAAIDAALMKQPCHPDRNVGCGHAFQVHGSGYCSVDGCGCEGFREP